MGAAGATIGLTLLGPWAADVLSGGQIDVPAMLALAFGLLLVAQAVHFPASVLLVIPGEARWQALWTVVMAAIGVGLGCMLAGPFGAVGVVCAAALGVLLVLARLVPPDRLELAPRQQWMVVFFLAVVFWVTLLLFVRDGLVNSFSQGRHFFPVLVPAAALFVAGLRGVIPRIDDRNLVVSLVLGLALLDALSLVTTVIPFFYGVALAAVP